MYTEFIAIFIVSFGTNMLQVSQRYLELTKKKLELTRLPRELELPDTRLWEHGTPKSVLEPLLDFW
jgi:hypothetical protein